MECRFNEPQIGERGITGLTGGPRRWCQVPKLRVPKPCTFESTGMRRASCYVCYRGLKGRGLVATAAGIRA